MLANTLETVWKDNCNLTVFQVTSPHLWGHKNTLIYHRTSRLRFHKLEKMLRFFPLLFFARFFLFFSRSEHSNRYSWQSIYLVPHMRCFKFATQYRNDGMNEDKIESLDCPRRNGKFFDKAWHDVREDRREGGEFHVNTASLRVLFFFYLFSRDPPWRVVDKWIGFWRTKTISTSGERMYESKWRKELD